MGSFDGAEVCELVGLYLLEKLVKKDIFKREHVGLYRDDGLAVVEVKRDHLKVYNDKIKAVHRAAKEEKLEVIIEKAKQGIDFLDVSMDLVSKVYTPYTKPGDKLCYVDTRSNHPPTVFKAVPKGVANRIATNSSSKKVFEAAKGPFIKALRRAHYAGGGPQGGLGLRQLRRPPHRQPANQRSRPGGGRLQRPLQRPGGGRLQRPLHPQPGGGRLQRPLHPQSGGGRLQRPLHPHPREEEEEERS